MPAYVLIKVMSWLWDNRAGVLAVFAFIMWVTELAQKMVIAGFVGIFNTISSINLDELEQVNFSAVEFIGVGNAIFPFSEMLSLLVIYYTLWLNLIVFRWIKSFIPTASN